MAKQTNLFGGGALKQLENTILEDAPNTEELEERSEKKETVKTVPAKPKEKSTEPKPAAPKKQSTLQDDFKNIQKGKGGKVKKLVSIPASYESKINEMIQKGECASFSQLFTFLLDKFFEA